MLVALAVGAIAACGSPDGSAAGLITDIDTLGLGRVQAFTLRTDDGASLRFTVRDGPDLSSGGFPADHLREHMATGTGVAVAYRTDGETLVVLRLTDAPWVGQ